MPDRFIALAGKLRVICLEHTRYGICGRELCEIPKSPDPTATADAMATFLWPHTAAEHGFTRQDVISGHRPPRVKLEDVELGRVELN